MLSKIHIPIKYKFLSVILFIMFSALGVFFYFTYTTFSEDKKLFVMDLNMTLLKATTSEIKLDLKSRLEVLQVFVPRIYNPITNEKGEKEDPFIGLPDALKDEIIGVTFLRKNGETKWDVTKKYRNTSLLAKRGLSELAFEAVDRTHPLPLDAFQEKQTTDILNRSTKLKAEKGNLDLSILTFLVTGNFINDDSKEVIIVVDLVQDFLRKKLQQSEIAEVFLMYKNGNLLSHPNLQTTVNYSSNQYPHPVLSRLAERQLPRESLEIEINGEEFLCNVSETGFKNIYAVSQIRKSEAFLALKTLLEKSVLISMAILALALIFSILFASRLTSNIRKLKEAAEQIGLGHLKIKLNIHSNDELQSVAESFQWMSNRLKHLITETAEKARLEDELETARLVQSTLLSTAEINSEAVELISYYQPATECGGDFWDAYLQGNTLTVFIGDATGHGAPAAIVTAVAKSCFSTLNSVYANTVLTPDQFMEILNRIIFESCKGKLLMTMCIVQINLDTGELLLSNAGHESPLRVGTSQLATGSENGNRAESLFARGERLGFNPDVRYESTTFKLNLGDALMLYTDGISEARDASGKEWGERSLRKALSQYANMNLTETRDGLVKALNAHTQESPQEDDITFVLLKWRKQLSVPKPNLESDDSETEAA